MANEQQNHWGVGPSKKWKKAANAGFQILPDVLLKRQAELGLNAVDLVVLINVTMHWWYEEKKPFPRSQTIAKRMSVDPRTVQRSMQKLQKLKLVNKVSENDQTVCDLTGLVSILSKLAIHEPGYRDRYKNEEFSNEEAPF